MIRIGVREDRKFLVVDDWAEIEDGPSTFGSGNQRHIYRADGALAGKVTGFNRDTEKATIFLVGPVTNLTKGQIVIPVFLGRPPKKKNRFEMALEKA